ncbi:ATP synthase subunit beta [Quillaja saponaria]|uniref:ATP synthase subunit beta, mitochondrial n=1 Tax=Quillaja saponaria TaxID=32244 RepID=A0AAD7M623_QUISA|nr:ATP synthase subunit beta [Quillaja saponaria]
MNEPPGARARVGLTGLTVVEHFRDAKGQDVLLFIDNIFFSPRLTQRCLLCLVVFHQLSVISLHWLQILEVFKSILPPPRRVPLLLCRLFMCLLMTWQILLLQPPLPILMPLQCCPDRRISELGIYPAIDPLDSTSCMLSPHILGEEHYNTALGVQKVLQNYKNLQDIIAILGMDELSEDDKLTVAHAHKIQGF